MMGMILRNETGALDPNVVLVGGSGASIWGHSMTTAILTWP